MLDKNAQIVKFIIERLQREVGRTFLLKLVYLGDYFSRRLFGRPISTFKYVWYEYGPFDKKFYDCVDKLSQKKSIHEESFCFALGKGFRYHNLPKTMKYSLTLSEQYVLEFVIRNFRRLDLKELLEEVVYKTEPMAEGIQKKAYGKALNMDQINNIDKALYGGLEPEAIIEAEKTIERGKTRPLDEVFGALSH